MRCFNWKMFSLWVAILPLFSVCALAQNKWWNPQWNYRVPISVDAQGVERRDIPVELNINFTDILALLGDEAGFNADSIRVVEVDQQGRVVDDKVSFQFDRDASYNSVTKAIGTLVILAKGKFSGRRLFNVYFDTGVGFRPVPVPSQVTLTNNVVYEGQESYRIITEQATYIYHKLGGGFASIVDNDGLEWIGYKEKDKEGGERGFPNLGEFGRPGSDLGRSKILSMGPVHIAFQSETLDRKTVFRWDVFPRFARLTVLRSAKPYSVEFDGLPAGNLEFRTSFAVNSDGRKIYPRQDWNKSLPDPHWVYLGNDRTVRSFFMVNRDLIDKADDFSVADGKYVSFAFGRKGRNGERLIQGAPGSFVFGIIDDVDYLRVNREIAGAFKEMRITQLEPEGREIPFALRDGKAPVARTVASSESLPSYLNKPEHQFFAGYCTWYAARKFKEFTGMPVTWSGDGGIWFDNAAAEGRRVTVNPREAVPGSVMVWTRGPYGKGHVAFVEDVDDNGIFITEMNVRGRWIVSDAYIPFDNPDKGTKYKFKGVILPH